MSRDYYREGEYSEMQTPDGHKQILAKLREIKCDTNSYFINFINWLAREEGWSGSEICSVVEKPHLYKKQYNRFIKEYWDAE
tara:strand:- start:271 stop:516 length:246 start_codon:yes stop_codon:yes gene_type:complete